MLSTALTIKSIRITYIYTMSLNVMRYLLIESIKGVQNKQVTRSRFKGAAQPHRFAHPSVADFTGIR